MTRNSTRPSSEKYDQVYSQCSLIEKGGKSEIDCNSSDGDCNCFQEDGTGCMFGLCVCLYKEHLVFDHMNCNEIQHLNHYENDTESKDKCPRMCRALDESNTCMPPTIKNETTGRCHCPDGNPIVPFITKQLTLNTTATVTLCGDSIIPPTITSPLPTSSFTTLSPTVSV